MTLDTYKKHDQNLRVKFKHLDDDKFSKFAMINMASIYYDIEDKRENGLDKNKAGKLMIEKKEKEYQNWSDELNKILFKNDLKKCLENIKEEPYINLVLKQEKGGINIRGGFMRKAEKGVYTYYVCKYNTDKSFEEYKHDSYSTFTINESNPKNDIGTIVNTVSQVI